MDNDTVKRGRAYSKIIHLSFPPESSGSPVICRLARQYDLDFSIIKSQITPKKEGYLTLRIEAEEEKWRAAKDYLEDQGIKVETAAQRITRDEKSCMHCGLCTGVCPAGALSNSITTRMVIFDPERCTACGFCTRACPVHAMRVELEGEAL